MIEIIDYSTETGLRVRILSGDTGTAVNLTGDEWRELLAQCKSGLLDDYATRPKQPFIY